MDDEIHYGVRCEKKADVAYERVEACFQKNEEGNTFLTQVTNNNTTTQL